MRNTVFGLLMSAIFGLLMAGPAFAEHNNGNDGVIPPPFQDGWSPGQGGQGGAGGGGGAGGAGGDASATSSSTSSAVGVGSASATVQGGHTSVRSSNDVDAEPAYAPDVSVHPTIVCGLAQGASGGAGGVVSFGLGISYTEEDCVDREWIRLGLDGGNADTQAMANRVAQMRLQEIMERYQGEDEVQATSVSAAHASGGTKCGYDKPGDLIEYDWC